jgi:glucuronoarabinoxylan endo-1,4-beta-xylanase
MSKLPPLSLFWALWLLGVPSLEAASIQWAAPVNIHNDADVSTFGTPLYAETWGTAGTVNGVAFAFDGSTTGDAKVGIAFPATAGTSTTAVGGANAPYNNLSTSYKRVVRGLVYGATGATGKTTTGTITLKGLTVGTGYQVQIWINDSRSGAAGGASSYPTRVTTLGSTGGNSVSLAHYVGGTATSPDGGLGQYAIGTFLADATTQVINVTASNTLAAGTAGIQLNSILVSSIVLNGTATVSYASTKQRIDGFGAASSWDSSWTTAQADLFFSTNPGGVGLSLLRSRIAPDGSSVETNIMQMAQARGARVWSSPWSPPASMKTSASVNGGSLVSSTANYQSYAGQLASYVATMKRNYGINLQAVSVQNEPDVSQTYESCLWTATQIHDFIPYLAAALSSAGVSSTKIMVPESLAWGFSLATNTMSDPVTAAAVGILGGHNYGSTASAVTQFGTPPPVPLWETEHYFGSDDSIQNGLAVAQEMHSFLTVAQASAYHYWWLKGSGTGSIAGDSTATPAKRLFVMGNYSKFVRPGFYRVDATNSTIALITAYKDPASSNYVIVAANPTAWPVTQTFNVASCPSFTSLNPWVTSATLSLSQQAAVNVSGGAFTYVLPAWSVVTFTSAAAPTPLIVLTGNDGFTQSSFNAKGNWDDTVAPGAGSDYTVAQYALRTTFLAGNIAFAGRSLTLPPLGSLSYNGVDGCTLTVPNLLLTGGAVNITYPSSYFTLAGNVSVSADSIIDPGSDAGHTITVAANLSGSGKLSNGNGGPGTVAYTGANSAFTGALYVNGGTILQAGSQANLGGNPATFNAGQLTLDNATLQPLAGFTMANANSGVTLASGGGKFAVNSGLALNLVNPVSGPGGLTKTGTGSLVLLGANTYAGTTTVSAGSLTTVGLSGSGAVTVSSGATLSGTGTIAGPTTISGTLAPSSSGMTFSSALTFAAGAHLQWPLAGNSTNTSAVQSASASIAAGAVVDLVFNGSGSATDFSAGFWSTAQSWPLLNASTMSGTFALGNVSTDAGGRSASWFGAFSLRQTATSVSLVWTPAPPWQQWRATHYGADYANSAISGPNVIPAPDGLTNLLKYTLKLEPATSYPPGTNWNVALDAGGHLQMTVTKNPSATDVTLAVQVTGNISDPASWTAAGTTIDLNTPTTLQVHDNTPNTAAQNRFIRLQVTQP